MNKILRNILSITVVSASFASCSQVDMVSEEELVEQKKSTAVTVSLPDWPTTRTVVFATNTVGSCDTVFTYAFGKENKLTNIPMGKYKFYAINRNTGYDYENFNFDALSKGSQYYGNVNISCKTTEYSTSDEGLKKALSGKYISRNSGEIYADSTMLVEVKLGQEAHATFQKPYKLTTQYKVSGSIKSSRAAKNVYVEICDIIGKKKPNGAVVVGVKKVKCVFSVGGVAKDTKKEFEQFLTVLGVSKTGTANIYVRFRDDDTSTIPEMKSVSYTVVDGQDDDGTKRRIINLGDITF